MAITVTVSDTPTYVTVSETTNNVVLNRSDNPITVSTSLDLVQTEGSSDDITVFNNGSAKTCRPILSWDNCSYRK